MLITLKGFFFGIYYEVRESPKVISLLDYYIYTFTETSSQTISPYPIYEYLYRITHFNSFITVLLACRYATLSFN
jgi:bifunctional pyridoxal-dependent enzyme with beta-cystathionase and maltose regulon repressor activities